MRKPTFQVKIVLKKVTLEKYDFKKENKDIFQEDDGVTI